MAIYTDRKGDKWELRFSVPAMIRIARKLGLTLQSVVAWQTLNVADMLEAVPLLLADQLRERKISVDDFLANLSPTELPDLFTALGVAVTEAFPELKKQSEASADPLAQVPMNGR